MIRRLTAAQVQSAFDDFVLGLAKQHLRVPFRNRFGTGREVAPATFKRGSSLVPRDRPVKNLLQEQPEKLVCTRIIGTKGALAGEEWQSPSGVTIGDLLGSGARPSDPDEVTAPSLADGYKPTPEGSNPNSPGSQTRGPGAEPQPTPEGSHLRAAGGDQGLVVQGHRARLYIYADSSVDTVSVLRIVTEPFGEEKKALPPKPSRKARAGVKPGRPAGRPKGRR